MKILFLAVSLLKASGEKEKAEGEAGIVVGKYWPCLNHSDARLRMRLLLKAGITAQPKRLPLFCMEPNAALWGWSRIRNTGPAENVLPADYHSIKQKPPF